jgi:hypothetical protein
MENDGTEAALTIQDVNNGIDFKRKDDSVFKLTSDKIETSLLLNSSAQIITSNADGITAPKFTTSGT